MVKTMESSGDQKQNSWCPLPWMSQSIRNNGELRLCCHANQGKDRGILRHPEGTAVLAGVDDLTAARNAPLLKEVRVSMLKGEWHPSCLRCQSEEKAGMRSRRAYESELWASTELVETSFRNTRSDGEVQPEDFPLQHMDLRFGNLCNLKCRSCGPTDSSKWYGDYYKLFGKHFSESTQSVELRMDRGRVVVSPDPYSWHESPLFWEQLDSQIDSLKKIYLVGGEPLLIRPHYDFLQRCIDKGRASEIKIEYNSNISSIPQRAWSLWKHFREVQVGSSIDGIGEVNEYIRHPSKWEVIEKNLRLLDQAEGNFRILISATVMIYNILHLPDMMIWKAKQNFVRTNMDPWKPLITPHPLHRPEFLNIQALPKALKLKVDLFFSSKRPELERAIVGASSIKDKARAIKSAFGILDHYSQFMWQRDLSEEFPRFLEYTKKLDEFREEKMQMALPLLHKFIQEEYFGRQPATHLELRSL